MSVPWICPKCEAVYGPGVTECRRCNAVAKTGPWPYRKPWPGIGREEPYKEKPKTPRKITEPMLWQGKVGSSQ